MAAALANVVSVMTTAEGDLMVAMNCAFVGSDVPGGTTSGEVTCTFPGDAQPAAIRSAMSNAISVYAAQNGFAVAGANMSIPTFQKG